MANGHGGRRIGLERAVREGGTTHGEIIGIANHNGADID